MSFAVRLGNATTSEQLLNVVTLDDPGRIPIVATVLPAGLADIGPADLRVDELPERGVWVVRVRFHTLLPWTDYTYRVIQGPRMIEGSFRTMPADQSTPFSFIVGTCDWKLPLNPTNTFRTIRKLVEESAIPVVHLFIIDDVHYADVDNVVDTETGLVATGRPQDTGVGADFAKAWTASYGLLKSAAKWMLPDRQWVARNLPTCFSGGDHALAQNWCRGNVDPEGIDRMFRPCDRGPGSFEDIAKAEWDAFYGAINPPPLRENEWHWGKDIGPVRMSLWDMSLHSEPYDSRQPTDTPYFGARQIRDHQDFLDVDTHPFKIAFHESGVSRVGQPWLEHHPTEAHGWREQVKASNNLNGQDGNLLLICGDNHTVHTASYDDFWIWSAGTFGDSNAVGGVGFGSRPWRWGGELKYWETSHTNIGDRFIHNIIRVTVHADKVPKYIEVEHIDGGRGIVKYAARLTFGAANNQMIEL